MGKPGVLDDYLSERELARQLGRTRRTLQRWRRLRTGPTPTLLGTRVVYNVDDVRAWLRRQRVEEAA